MINNDVISRQAVINAIANTCFWLSADNWEELMQCINSISSVTPPVSTKKTDVYKQGWHDAITAALKETHNIYTEDGHFRVVQEETLIGLGMAYEQVSTEKTGRWIKYGVPRCGEQHYQCTSCGYYINFGQWGELYTKEFIYCPHCGAKMEVEE